MVGVACRDPESHSEDAPALQELADRAGIGVFHFQRTFRRVAGVTPKHFPHPVRMRKLKEGLKRNEGVTETIHASGFGLSSRL
jgi:AraC family transcriptional regulator of adaptative response/methylated-DNA-[protein]-cysteine methyltransferase